MALEPNGAPSQILSLLLVVGDDGIEVDLSEVSELKLTSLQLEALGVHTL